MKTDTKIIVALDFPSIEPLRKFVKLLTPDLCRVKIGNILFTRYGPSLVEELMQVGFEVFLDLKFHDIPATVAGACRSAAELGVWMVNLHVSSGERALQAAREILNDFKKPPLLIGVTVLTSLVTKDLAALGIQTELPNLVLQMAHRAKSAGLDGVVCSAEEATLLRRELGEKFVLVTPGIRLTLEDKNDQQRVMTPEAAFVAGASYLVIGRPITQAKDPVKILRELAEE